MFQLSIAELYNLKVVFSGHIIRVVSLVLSGNTLVVNWQGGQMDDVWNIKIKELLAVEVTS